MKFCLLRAVFVMLAMAALSVCARGPTLQAWQGLVPGAQGIDLSHHNGEVDWVRLGASDIEFVYLKASEGVKQTDPLFQRNWRSAQAEGFVTGAYHFYLLCRDGAAQAANFIRQVEVSPANLPPAVDLEYAQNCKPARPRAGTLRELRIFLDALEAEYGKAPVLYTTPEFHRDWLDSGFERYPLWIRRLGNTPPDEPAQIWQYTMRARVSGIASDVDLNRVVKTPAR
jgi:lysozyme